MSRLILLDGITVTCYMSFEMQKVEAERDAARAEAAALRAPSEEDRQLLGLFIKWWNTPWSDRDESIALAKQINAILVATPPGAGEE